MIDTHLQTFSNTHQFWASPCTNPMAGGVAILIDLKTLQNSKTSSIVLVPGRALQVDIIWDDHIFHIINLHNFGLEPADVTSFTNTIDIF